MLLERTEDAPLQTFLWSFKRYWLLYDFGQFTHGKAFFSLYRACLLMSSIVLEWKGYECVNFELKNLRSMPWTLLLCLVRSAWSFPLEPDSNSWENWFFTLLDTGRKDILVVDRKRILSASASWPWPHPWRASSREPSASSLHRWRGHRCCSRGGWSPASPSCSMSRPSCSAALQQAALPASYEKTVTPMEIFGKPWNYLLGKCHSFHLFLIRKGFGFPNRMYFHVLLKILLPGKGLSTNRICCFNLTFARQPRVSVQVIHSWKCLSTHFTLCDSRPMCMCNHFQLSTHFSMDQSLPGKPLTNWNVSDYFKKCLYACMLGSTTLIFSRRICPTIKTLNAGQFKKKFICKMKIDRLI